VLLRPFSYPLLNIRAEKRRPVSGRRHSRETAAKRRETRSQLACIPASRMTFPHFSYSDSFVAVSRVVTSVAPPAANETTMRIGLLG
jgi:hypothetical protein